MAGSEIIQKYCVYQTGLKAKIIFLWCFIFRAFRPERRFYSSCLPVAVVDVAHRSEDSSPNRGGPAIANQSPYSGTNNKTSKGTATERCTLRLTRAELWFRDDRQWV